MASNTVSLSNTDGLSWSIPATTTVGEAGAEVFTGYFSSTIPISVTVTGTGSGTAWATSWFHNDEDALNEDQKYAMVRGIWDLIASGRTKRSKKVNPTKYGWTVMPMVTTTTGTYSWDEEFTTTSTFNVRE